MKASDLFVKALENEGVKYIFGLPGEENEDLLFSLKNSSIQFIPTRHEQGAAFMANVYGRLTGKAGICLSTLGPGATNLLTGLADAHLDKAPVVAITGQGELSRSHKEAHQMINIVNIFNPVTKWNCSVSTAEIIPEAVRKAFKLAEMEKPGVTHIELPEDIAKAEVQKDIIPKIRVRRPAADYKAINEAIELIKSAKKPIILAGNGAIRKLASKHLRIFAEKFNIPVVSTFMGKGAISDRHELSLHSVGLQAKDLQIFAFEDADLIISVGFDIAELYPKTLALMNPSKDKKIIHIDFEPIEVYEYFVPQVEIICDISDALYQLTHILSQDTLQAFPAWTQKLRAGIEANHASYEIKDDVFTVPGVLRVLREKMNDEDILLSDVGAHKMWIGRNFATYEPGTLIISNGMASMGISVPGAIAAKLAHPDRNVISLSGDGGFLINSQEIETARRLNLPMTFIITNDNNYGLITMKQQSHTDGKFFGTELTNPDFVAYAKSFGINGFKPETKEELEHILAECMSNGQINLVEISIDPGVNLQLGESLKKLTKSDYL